MSGLCIVCWGFVLSVGALYNVSGALYSLSGLCIVFWGWPEPSLSPPPPPHPRLPPPHRGGTHSIQQYANPSWSHNFRLYSHPKGGTQKRLYKAPTDYTKPRKDYTNTWMLDKTQNPPAPRRGCHQAAEGQSSQTVQQLPSWVLNSTVTFLSLESSSSEVKVPRIRQLFDW